MGFDDDIGAGNNRLYIALDCGGNNSISKPGACDNRKKVRDVVVESGSARKINYLYLLRMTSWMPQGV